jgi:hypothetical protein
MHNKWLQASGKNISDLYIATLNDYCRAALQSTAYHNYLKDIGRGTDLIGQFLGFGLPHVLVILIKLLRQLGNSRVLHLEGESIFGSAKRKLDLPPGNESDSHRHDRVNLLFPKLAGG